MKAVEMQFPGRVVGMTLLGILTCVSISYGQQQRTNPLRPAGRTVGVPSPQTYVSAKPAAPSASAINTGSLRQVAFGRSMPRHATPGYVPRHEILASMDTPIMTSTGEPVDSISLEPMPTDGLPMADGCCGETTTCDSCGNAHGCLIPCPTFSLRNIEWFGGVQGFTGPMNQGNAGSFGFHYGLNWGAPLPCTPGGALGMQAGFRGVSSNYSGSNLTPDTRNQQFVTAGLFRRVDWGLQGGVVFDYMHDEWYYDASLTQVRGELSWVYPACHELGFWFAARGRDDTVTTNQLVNGQLAQGTATMEPYDLFAFFYRRRFEGLGGGAGRIYGGFTGNSDGLIGADIKLPLNENWALQSGFTYVIPDESNKQTAYYEEAWNVGITLVWYPGQRKSVGNDYFRPLFDVADNGSFINHLK